MPPTFAQLGVPKFIDRALARRGITQPFEIQAATMSDAMAGRDVCGHAPTGSGKTLAYGIPLVARAGHAQPFKPGALVLAPTRELSEQITTELRSFSGRTRVAVVYGGVGYGPQARSLRRGVDILVACPGRLEDLIDQGATDLSAVERVVIDEADRMADMGFIPAVRRLLDQTARKRQTMLFSATLDGDIASLSRDYQHDPVLHEVGEESPDVIAADHVFWTVTAANRNEVSVQAIDAAGPTIVFCRTRHGCDRVARQLNRRGVRAATIHGGRNQNQRARALGEFATGRAQALVATDVVARGIHVEDVGAVIHYDVPADHKTYLHRSGRTARAGKGGVVISLIQPDQVGKIRYMQRRLGLRQPITAVDLTAIQPLGRRTPRSERPKVTADPSRRHANSQRRHTKPQRPSSNKRSRNRRGNRPPNHRNRNRQSNRPPKHRNRNRRASVKASN